MRVERNERTQDENYDDCRYNISCALHSNIALGNFRVWCNSWTAFLRLKRIHELHEIHETHEKLSATTAPTGHCPLPTDY